MDTRVIGQGAIEAFADNRRRDAVDVTALQRRPICSIACGDFGDDDIVGSSAIPVGHGIRRRRTAQILDGFHRHHPGYRASKDSVG